MDAVVYDAGMLIALTGRKKKAQVEHASIMRRVRPIIPGPVLAQAWRDSPQTRYIVSRYLNDCATYTDYTVQDYKRVGVMLGDALLPAKKHPDVVDALVVLTAAKHGNAVILTSDPYDIRAYAATLPTADIVVLDM
ncbi:MAG: hypothetical protein DLM55_01245 [Acidimicrobiales bacterium]|nr:MAG: hypothetical protein DLM55_01245 [Acidimicrobiales bacterium]